MERNSTKRIMDGRKKYYVKCLWLTVIVIQHFFKLIVQLQFLYVMAQKSLAYSLSYQKE